MAHPKIRPYVLSDRASLLETINSVCAEGRWMETLRYEPTPMWEYALANSNCPHLFLWVAVDAERVVGWCRVFPDTDTPTQASIAIGLLPEYREQRWGTKLFGTAVRWACQQGFNRLYLTTRLDNTRAIHLFRKFGFIGSRFLGENWIEMRHPLDLGVVNWRHYSSHTSWHPKPMDSSNLTALALTTALSQHCITRGASRPNPTVLAPTAVLTSPTTIAPVPLTLGRTPHTR